MYITKSAKQHHKNGQRISAALFNEILDRARKMGQVEQITKGTKRGVTRYWIHGTTESVYAFETKAGAVNWNDEIGFFNSSISIQFRQKGDVSWSTLCMRGSLILAIDELTARREVNPHCEWRGVNGAGDVITE